MGVLCLIYVFAVLLILSFIAGAYKNKSDADDIWYISLYEIKLNNRRY